MYSLEEKKSKNAIKVSWKFQKKENLLNLIYSEHLKKLRNSMGQKDFKQSY